MKAKLFLVAILLFAVSFISLIVSAQRRADEKPIAGDFKITLRTTMAGQSTQSTTMIKGARERNETSMNAGGYSMTTVNITQCDLRRTIQVNDRARKYLITPMDSDSSGDASTGNSGAAGGGGSQRGGVVTLSINTIDTGERKEMFGFTARHFKRTTMMESSPDACNQQKMKIETDGWYINLEYGLSCPANRPPQTGRATAPGGCRDRFVYRNTGPANLGYPLQETMTMYGPDGSATYTMTKEVLELSRQTLDAALFDVPAGYTEARSAQEMYAAPSMAEVMAMARQQQGQSNAGNETSGSSGQTSSAPIRVGVLDFNNKTKTNVSTDSLRQQLIAALTSNGVEAIALNASSPSEAATEAQAKQCAYILFTDIATLKVASAGKKLGGLLGRATGVGPSDAGKSEAKLDFRLVAAGSSSPTAQSSASAKEDTQDATIAAAIQNEARAVAEAIPRP